MKKTTLLFFIVLLIVVAYFYFRSTGAKESFVSPASIKGDNAFASLIFLSKAQKSADLKGDQIRADMPAVEACKNVVIPSVGVVQIPAYMPKECYNALLAKYGLSAETNLPAVPVLNLSVDEIAATLSAFIQRKGQMTEYSASSMADEMSKQGTFCTQKKIGKTNYVGPVCYNALLKKYVTDVTVEQAAIVPDQAQAQVQTPIQTSPSQTQAEPESSAKDYRISFLKNLAIMAGFTNIKTDEIEKVYSTADNCKKDSNEYDTDCIREMANTYGINIGGAAGAEKKSTTIEFGKKVDVAPQSKGGAEGTSADVITTDGSHTKIVNIPSIEQGTKFANKQSKINVINLRDYVHKDNIPCWSCKL
jgi:hypothetical protein